MIGIGGNIGPQKRNDRRNDDQGYATDLITDMAIDWVESLDGDDPWCVLVWHKAPHRPWEPKPEHRAVYETPRPVPATFWDDHATRSASVSTVP